MTLTDAELIEGCKRGDREAQHELYVRSSEKIYRLLLSMTRNPDAAFDLAQNAYLRAFSRIGQFNGDSSLGTWLYRVAVNEALQFMRRRGTLALLSEAFPSEALTPDEGERITTRMDVNAALDLLNTSDRTILILRYQEGLDYREIADVLDCAAGTVASRLNRARDRLRQVLGGGYGNSEEMAKAKHLTDAE
jgi:RNA polymerase sigma-70 factor, ECF subfamily